MSGSPAHRGRLHLRGGPAGVWLGYTGLYLLFTGFTWAQLVVGAIVALAAAALSLTALRAAELTVRGALPQFWKLRSVGEIFIGEARAVSVALVMRLRAGRTEEGRFVAFPPGEELEPSIDAAMTLEASLAPNTYIVGVVTTGSETLVLTHQFSPRPHARGSFPRWKS